MNTKTKHPEKSLRTQERGNGRPATTEELWDKHECAKFLGSKVYTIERLVKEERIPFLMLGKNRAVRFVPALIREWAVDQSMENFEGSI